MITQADLDWWLELAPSLTWTYAKTMPYCPHEYIVESRSLLTHEDFVRAGRVIRTFGEPGKFYRRTSLYLTSPDGLWKWWTMDPFVDDTNLVNRATTERTYGPQDAPRTASDVFTAYDAMATTYDARSLAPNRFAEFVELSRIIGGALGGQASGDDAAGGLPTVLDIGAGTGFTLDLGVTSPERYRAVDPSQAMLNHLVLKHPGARDLHPVTAANYLARAEQEPFDLVLALGGAGSHLSPADVEGALAFATRAAVITHFLPDCTPHLLKGEIDADTADASRVQAAELALAAGGSVRKIGAWQVAVVLE